METPEGSIEVESHSVEDSFVDKPGLQYLKDLFVPVSTSVEILIAESGTDTIQPPRQPSITDFDYHPTESREQIKAHAGDPHQWLPLTHRYMCRPALPNLAQSSGPATKTDWTAYLAWVLNDLSYRERTEDNVLIVNDVANVVSTNTVATCLNRPHFVGPLERASLLFYDLPVVEAGAVVGSEVHVLACDLLNKEFIVVWFEECPLGLAELAAGWKEKGTEMCRCNFQEIDHFLDDPKLADETSPAWEKELASRALPEWTAELGLKVCVLLIITQFILDFQGPFDLDIHHVWHLQALLTAWRRKVDRWWLAAKQAAALDLSDPGISSGSSAPPADESFEGPEGSPGSITFSFGNPSSRKELIASLESFTMTPSRGNTYKSRPEQCVYDEEDEEGWEALQNWAAGHQDSAVEPAGSKAAEKKELIASLEAFTMTPSRGNTYKRRPEQCIYDEEDEEGWGALQIWAAGQQDPAVEPSGSKPAEVPSWPTSESTTYATSSNEDASPTTSPTAPSDYVPQHVPLLQLNDLCPLDSKENSECIVLNVQHETSFEGGSIIAMANTLKELVEKQPSLNSVKNQKRLREFLTQLVNEAEANPLEVQREVPEPTEGQHTDVKDAGEGPTALVNVEPGRMTKEADGGKSDGNADNDVHGETKSVRFIEGPHPTVVIPEEEVSVLG